MTPSWMSEAVSFCTRCFGRAIRSSGTASRAAYIATISVAESLLELVNSNLAPDVSQIKDAFIRRQNAEADSAQANAFKKLAEAVEASNRADLPKRRDQMALLERDAKRLQNAKTQAEIDAIRSDAEVRKLQAIAEAKARLIEAMSKLSQEGGAAFFDKENLQQILGSVKEIPYDQKPKRDF